MGSAARLTGYTGGILRISGAQFCQHILVHHEVCEALDVDRGRFGHLIVVLVVDF